MPRQLVFILCALFLAACGTVSTSTPTQTLESTNTIAPPTATATITSTPMPAVTNTPANTPSSTPGSHLTVVPTVRPLSQEALTSIPRVTAIPASDSFPTLIPTMQPETISAELQVALQFRDLDALDGRPLSQITRWKYGYRFEWIDTNHLLLLPRVGQYENNGRNTQHQLVVASLVSRKVWVPPVDQFIQGEWGRTKLPRWSKKLGVFIIPNQDKSIVDIYTLEGKKLKTYTGNLTGVSPSGTKILVDSLWIDLESGKTVEFAWAKNNRDRFGILPIWSSDETQVYAHIGGYFYGNAKTGEGFEISTKSVDEQMGMGRLVHSYGQWVLNDSQLLVQLSYIDDSFPNFIPLFDPSEKTYHNLSALAGISTGDGSNINCIGTSVSPDGIHVWAKCFDGNYLVNLITLKTKTFPGYYQYVDFNWSPDGQFAWLDDNDSYNPRLRVLSVARQELISFPIEPAYDTVVWWHPTQNIAAYPSQNGKSLILLDAETMSVREVILPEGFCNTERNPPRCRIIWNPSGDQLSIKANGGSIWQLDYPGLETLEQLTPPADEFGWSPDGTKLAFTNHAGIFILEVGPNP